VKKGRGYNVAELLISNGKALSKFQEIVELQGGRKGVTIADVPEAKHKHAVKAEHDGRVYHIDNKMISKIARAAGAPMDKEAGVLLKCERGDKVRKGDTLFEIHSNSEGNLSFAIKALEGWEGVELEKVVLSEIR